MCKDWAWKNTLNLNGLNFKHVWIILNPFIGLEFADGAQEGRCCLERSSSSVAASAWSHRGLGTRQLFAQSLLHGEASIQFQTAKSTSIFDVCALAAFGRFEPDLQEIPGDRTLRFDITHALWPLRSCVLHVWPHLITTFHFVLQKQLGAALFDDSLSGGWPGFCNRYFRDVHWDPAWSSCG